MLKNPPKHGISLISDRREVLAKMPGASVMKNLRPKKGSGAELEKRQLPVFPIPPKNALDPFYNPQAFAVCVSKRLHECSEKLLVSVRWYCVTNRLLYQLKLIIGN
jgi:hypothetical protein